MNVVKRVARGSTLALSVCTLAWTSACGRTAATAADLLLVNGRVYTLAWGEPDLDGSPAETAPRTVAGWEPDARAVAMRNGTIVFAGTNEEAETYRGAGTRVIDLHGATVVPGLVESHVHIQELGQSLSRVDLRGLATEAAVVARVKAAAAQRPAGEWIQGYGWDDGAWATRLPTFDLLSREVPDHPVYLKGLHGFSVWGNRMAFARAGITRTTRAPTGGSIVRDAQGEPTGILTNRAAVLLESAVPPPSDAERQRFIRAGLDAVARAGYVAVHEAGADAAAMRAFAALEERGLLPVRVYAMLSARDENLIRTWLERGPDVLSDRMLVTRAVKVFYDAALGSRGARLLEDYADQPGHRGVGGSEYGFDREKMAAVVRAGFQLAVHAIGDAANRETLDFFESVIRQEPSTSRLRHRIEHAQVVRPDDVPRLAALGVIASMQPPHAVEDKSWAEDRLGAERVRHAYSWRTLRRAGALLAFNSDLPGSDYDFFYGFHAAVTRRDKRLQPQDGWYRDERLTPEEALRAYTCWGAYAAFMEEDSGTIERGKRADLTVLSLDVLNVGERDPARLLEGRVLYTIIGGQVLD